MYVVSYREYLDYIERHGKSNIPIAKMSAVLVLVLFLTFSLATTYSSYQNKKIEPQIAQVKYFDTAGDTFYKSSQALDDLESSFQVAGVKTEKIDSLKEGSASATTPGFFITLGDIQKSIAQIKTVKETVVYERDQLTKTNVPEVYTSLNNQLVDYLNLSETFIADNEKTQEQLKDLVLASGPNFYLPILSDEQLWQGQDIDKIKSYYENKKKDAQAAADMFKKIEVRSELKSYKDIQLTFFQLVANVSDNITNVLNKKVVQSDNFDTATLQEEAYQVLVGAKRENEIIARQLLEERQKLTSSAVHQDALASLKNRERIIESGLSQGNKVQMSKSNDNSSKNIVMQLLNFSGFTKQ